MVAVFRKPEFNVASFIRDAMTRGPDGVARLAQLLEDCTTAVEEELRREIASCHQELLQSAGSVDDLDGQLGGVRAVVDALKQSISVVKNDLVAPFHCVKQRALLLARMQQVNVLVRKLLRFLFDVRKLRSQMESPAKDYSKAAHTLFELEQVLQESGLERVEVLRVEVNWIRETSGRVRRQAEEDLRTGTRQGNQISLSTSLQVFFNLHCLWPQLRGVLGELLEELHKLQLSAGANFHHSLDIYLQLLAAHVQRVHLLDELVKAKTDPLSHLSFAVGLAKEGVESLTNYFWVEAAKAFANKVAKASQDKQARRALLVDFPKVLRTINDTIEKINLSARGRGQILRVVEQEQLYSGVQQLRDDFLAESIKRVTEPVEMMLPDKLFESVSASGQILGGNTSAGGFTGKDAGAANDDSVSDELPTSHDLRRYVQLLSAELERVECSPDLLLKESVRNVRTSVLLFATRLEQLVDSSCLEFRCFFDEGALRLRSPLPMPAAGHARNVRLFGLANQTTNLLKESLPPRFQSAVFTQQVQSTLRQTQEAIISPTILGLRRAVRATATRMCEGVEEDERTEDGARGLLVVGQACTHTSKYFFSLFGAGQLQSYMKDICLFVLRSFLSSAVLVRPREDVKRATLVQDMQTIETTLSALDSDFQANIRHEASVFKEFRKLLFTSAQGKAELDELTNVIPLPLLLAHFVGQLPPEVPDLPKFRGVGADEYLESTLLPLWDEQPDVVAAFKAEVAALVTKHASGSTSAIAVFLAERAGS